MKTHLPAKFSSFELVTPETGVRRAAFRIGRGGRRTHAKPINEVCNKTTVFRAGVLTPVTLVDKNVLTSTENSLTVSSCTTKSSVALYAAHTASNSADQHAGLVESSGR